MRVYSWVSSDRFYSLLSRLRESTSHLSCDNLSMFYILSR